MTIGLTSQSFQRLVTALKTHKKTCTVVESCCGGLIQSSILAVPGSSSVYYGGTISYNTGKSRPLLLNDAQLHSHLLKNADSSNKTCKDSYVETKVNHVDLVAKAYCEAMKTDYAIVESGASGPTFRPDGMETGFAAFAIAKRDSETGQGEIVRRSVVQSPHNNREINMRMFADAAADLATEAIIEGHPDSCDDRSYSNDICSNEYQFDRSTHLRANQVALDELANNPNTKYILLHKNASLFWESISSEEPIYELAFLDNRGLRDISKNLGLIAKTSFLGILNGHDAYFGVDILHKEYDDMTESLEKILREYLPFKEGMKLSFQDTRTGAPLLSSLHNELVLHATALSQWQRRNEYCSQCSGKTMLIDGGSCLQCTNCGAKAWPRQDPSMIAVVQNRMGDKVLLARSKRHPPRLHTALAGFVEAGETFENALAREVFEEVGIHIDKDTVNYVGSQPWPFPQSCMIAFTVSADDSQQLNIDKNEIESARWFHKDEVRKAMEVPGPVMRKYVAEAWLKENPSTNLLIPPKGVIARTLLDTWISRLPI